MAGVPSLPPRWIERELTRLMEDDDRPENARPVRLIRWEGHRGVAEVRHLDVALARERWNTSLEGPSGERITVSTLRTWGTLRKGKAWSRELSTSRS